MTPLATLAETAAREFTALHASASRARAEGRIRSDAGRAAAEQRCRAWLAIACRLGSQLPQIEAGLAWWRKAFPRDRESLIRAEYADEIFPREIWIVELAQTRDRIFDAAEAAALAGTPDADKLVRRAIALRQLADHFAHDINGRHPMPPYVRPADRPAPAESAAA